MENHFGLVLLRPPIELQLFKGVMTILQPGFDTILKAFFAFKIQLDLRLKRRRDTLSETPIGRKKKILAQSENRES